MNRTQREPVRLWLTHKRRLDVDYCPRCLSPIIWIYDGIHWIPCDREPVLAYPGRGSKTVVYRRELCRDFHLFSDGSLGGEIPVSCHLPHLFSCRGSIC